MGEGQGSQGSRWESPGLKTQREAATNIPNCAHPRRGEVTLSVPLPLTGLPSLEGPAARKGCPLWGVEREGQGHGVQQPWIRSLALRSASWVISGESPIFSGPQPPCL